MEIKKRIRPSKRGLTFSFDGADDFVPGKYYRYLLDKTDKTLHIFPAESGLKISRKNSAGRYKALFDIRNKEVVTTLSEADYIKVAILNGKISVRAVYENAAANAKAIEYEMPEALLKAAGGKDCAYTVAGALGSALSSCGAGKDEIGTAASAIRVISLFSGAGMLDWPFAADEAFQIVYAAEHDPDAVNTYKANIGSHIRQCDIRDLKASDLPAADVIIGGPPCQPYSRANPSKTKRGAGHAEGDMLAEYVRLVKETGVKVFLIENVPQLLTDSYGENLHFITRELADWEISTKTVRDCDVGGYTKRKRALLIGSRIGKPVIPDISLQPYHTAGEAIRKVTPAWPNYADVTVPGPETKLRISMVPEGGNWKDLPEHLRTKGIHSNMYRRLNRNEPSITICNWRKYLLSPPRYDNSGYWDRILTVAEAAALSGLNGVFRFFGKLSSMQQQVGNGVPIAMGQFAKNIIKNLFLRYAESDFC